MKSIKGKSVMVSVVMQEWELFNCMFSLYRQQLLDNEWSVFPFGITYGEFPYF